jgi:hypothetical protein
VTIVSRFRNARRGIVDFWSIGLSSKSSLVFILIFTTIAVIDSTIVGFLTYSNYDLPVSTNIMIFVLFSVAFATISSILLNSVKTLTPSYKLPLIVKNSHLIISITLTLIIVILVIIIFQMTILNKYNVHLLSASTYVTHISALIFLGLLVYLFVGWFKSKKNYITMLYMISFILISTNIIISMTYLEYNFSRSYSVERKPYPIYLYVIRQEVTSFGESLATIFDVTYLSSFIAIWIATAILLSQYRYKLGRIKYYTLLSVPMIYYLFTFQGYFGNIFSQLVLHYPVTFGVTYTLFFSATKQIGALLFSLAFLTASFLVTNEHVRKSSLISAIGIAILFGSVEITTLQYRLYPPFGLVTEAFMPLGAYLLLAGLITSATNVARDAKLRKEFYKNAMSQISLLKTIGITEMEKELLKDYKPVLARLDEVEEIQYQPLEQSDVKQLIHDVLYELQSREKIKTKEGRKSNQDH